MYDVEVACDEEVVGVIVAEQLVSVNVVLLMDDWVDENEAFVVVDDEDKIVFNRLKAWLASAFLDWIFCFVLC